MSASDALTIWMLSTAMKAPSVAPITAIQVFVETAGVALSGVAAALGAPISAETALRVGWNVVMAVSPCLAEAGCIRRSVSIIRENVVRIVRSGLIFSARMGGLAAVRADRGDVRSKP